MKRLWAISLMLPILLTGAATDAVPGEGTRLSKTDRAVSLAVELEVRADRLEDRRDVCLAFGNGLEVDKKGIFSELRRRGLKLQGDEWCNQGPRGSVVSVVAPVRESPQGTYEVVVQLGDLRAVRDSGTHFGILVRRGTYVVRSEGKSQSELVAYQKSCCPDSPTVGP